MKQHSGKIVSFHSEKLQGIALSVDPGNSTGWANLDIESEEIKDFGVIDATGDEFINELAPLMVGIRLLIIEDQHFDRERNNPDTVIKLAARRGGIEMLWAMISGFSLGDQVVREKATKWQACLNLPATANRETRKRAALRQAISITRKRDIPQDAADAICQGAAIIRRLKAALLQRGASPK